MRVIVAVFGSSSSFSSFTLNFPFKHIVTLQYQCSVYLLFLAIYSVKSTMCEWVCICAERVAVWLYVCVHACVFPVTSTKSIIALLLDLWGQSYFFDEIRNFYWTVRFIHWTAGQQVVWWILHLGHDSYQYSSNIQWKFLYHPKSYICMRHYISLFNKFHRFWPIINFLFLSQVIRPSCSACATPIVCWMPVPNSTIPTTMTTRITMTRAHRSLTCPLSCCVRVRH